MYFKRFNSRSVEKEKINNRTDEKDFFVNQKEIRYAKLWVNIGNETDGKKSFERPVLILAKVWSLFRVLPMTTKGKITSNFYHKIISHNFGKSSFVILSQIRTIDKKRLLYPIWSIHDSEFQTIKKSLLQFMK